MSFCNCVWDRLASAGFDTEAKLKSLIASWRRTFLSRGVIVYPPVMKSAIVACVPQLRQQP